ncbi:hypothetical protein Ae717Ps2_2422c [Pseudonocardia sp. Ae717_Ps2]|nr:DUF4188 domain-containing protein [Pseudonocardia sp. Ae717_Ps2]OLM31527.1 hypothetical protein Ae717Ps2_2422c [Pseudonocardia sp. Ae717_Ps2]
MAPYTRTTNQPTEDQVVVFLIGMRFNRPWKVRA